MKKKFFKYNSHSTLFWLSMILLICIYIIIHDCEIPIIHFDTAIDKYIELIFLKSSTDGTFYNIAISYVAAYIFYIIQVYIPAITDNHHGINLLKNDITKTINNIQLLLLIIHEMTDIKNNELYLKDTMNDFYIIETSKNQILKINFLNTYTSLKELIHNKKEHLLTNPALNYLDNNLCELLYSLPIEDLFVISDNIYKQKKRNINTKIINNESISNTTFIISQLKQRYGFSFETYYITNDINLQTTYVAGALPLINCTQNELEIKIKLD